MNGQDPASEITGPSSEPRQPIVTMGSTTAPIVRTAGQGGLGALVVQGLQLFNAVDLSADQAIWLTTVLTIIFSALQNFIEKRRGVRLIGAAT